MSQKATAAGEHAATAVTPANPAVAASDAERLASSLGSRLVRWRNAMLARPGRTSDFDWSPPDYPRGYRHESAPVPAAFRARANAITQGIEGDWSRAAALVGHLVEHAQERGALRSDLEATYQGIRRGYGYCADFVRVFIALAHGAGIPVRQWAFSFDGYGGHGHTFVEVFAGGEGGWRMMDVFNNVYPVGAADGRAMTALQFRAALAARQPVRLLPIAPAGRPGYVFEQVALAYFERGLSEWYLVFGDDVCRRDGDWAISAARRLSRELGHLVALVRGLQPPIRLLVFPGNEAKVRHLLALRDRMAGLAVLAAAGLTALVLWRLLP